MAAKVATQPAVSLNCGTSGNMEFYNQEVHNEYQRVLRGITHDPYSSRNTLGLTDVIRAHYLIADFFLTEQRELGGIGPRDITLLESALYRPWIEFGGATKWPDPFDKAATTLFGLIKDHPFHDANKRTALLSILYLLAKQGRMPRCSKQDFENLTVEIAEMEIVKRARYKQLSENEEDPEVKYISLIGSAETREISTTENITSPFVI